MTADAWPATRWASLSAADVVALLSAPEVDGVVVARRLARLEQPSWSRRPRAHVLTPEGEVAAQELGDWVSTARERLAGWDGDADAAFAYTGRCGAATLAFDVLLRDIRTVVEDLRKAGLGAAFSEGFSA